MALVALPILFVGVVSAVLAGSTTALLLAFILPVTLPGDAASIPDRVAGWGLAAAVFDRRGRAAVARAGAQPLRERDRRRRAIARRLRADIAYMTGARGGRARPTAPRSRAPTRPCRALTAVLRQRLPPDRTDDGGPRRRPARRRAPVVQRDRAARTAPITPAAKPNAEACAVKTAAADVLERAAGLLGAPGPTDGLLGAERARALATLEPRRQPRCPQLAAPAAGRDRRRRPLDHCRAGPELPRPGAQLHRRTDRANTGSPPPPPRSMDRPPARAPARARSAVPSPRRTSARQPTSSPTRCGSTTACAGPAALGAGGACGRPANVQHGFWVVFGTLSVLRSNALSTGQNVVRALAGTTAGFVDRRGARVADRDEHRGAVGAAADRGPVRLPAPATISFAAGQAAFTVTLLILFNLLRRRGGRSASSASRTSRSAAR